MPGTLTGTRCACFFMLLFALSTAPAATTQEASSINPNERSARGLAKAYGFLLGQQMTLDEIAASHPHLKADALLARLTFEEAFPRLLQDFEAELGSILGIERVPALRDQVRQQLDAVRQPIGVNDALSFLNQVRLRARGEGIESEIFAYMLVVRYARRPVSEFTDGFKQRFQTDGTGKAQGVRLTLQLPLSWLQQEGERPHIVKKWTSEAGTGLSVITLDIRDTGGVSLTTADIAELVQSGEIREMFSSIGVVSDVRPFSIERRPGVSVRLSLSQERLGLRLASEGTLYQVFFGRKAVGILCAAGRPEPDRVGAAEAWKRLEPLCRQVANSLVLTQVY